MKNELTRLPLGLTAAASAAVAWIHKTILGSGTTTLAISNEKKKDMKIVKSLEDSGPLLKGVTRTIENETKEQRGGFFSMLLGNLGAILLENILSR